MREEGPVVRTRRLERKQTPRARPKPSDPSQEIYLLYRRSLRNAPNVQTLDMVLKQANDRKAFLGEDRCNKLETLADKRRRTFIVKEQSPLQKLKNAIPRVEKAEVGFKVGIDRALPTAMLDTKATLKPRKKKSTSSPEPPREEVQAAQT